MGSPLKKRKNESSNAPLAGLRSNGFQSTQSKKKATWQIHGFSWCVSAAWSSFFNIIFISPTLFMHLGRSQEALQGLLKTAAPCPAILPISSPESITSSALIRIFWYLTQ